MTAIQTIQDIRARPVIVPFRRPTVSASGAVPHAALVLVDLETEEGVTGRSYLFGFAHWALKPVTPGMTFRPPVATTVSIAPATSSISKGDASDTTTLPSAGRGGPRSGPAQVVYIQQSRWPNPSTWATCSTGLDPPAPRR